MNKGSDERILIIAPHHDDEVIGCGGSVASAARKKKPVDILYMTAGFAGVPGVRAKEKALAIREQEAIRAGKILGVRKQFFLREPDRGLSCSLPVIKKIVRILRQGKYTTLLFPHSDETDRDHRVTSEIAREAFWLASSKYYSGLGDPNKAINAYLYEVWSPMLSYHVKVDITGYCGIKKAALTAYRSQFNSNQISGLLGLNRYRAAMKGHHEYAIEVFRMLE
jgi:N-acetylglucosamine malate deacetylase 1